MLKKGEFHREEGASLGQVGERLSEKVIPKTLQEQLDLERLDFLLGLAKAEMAKAVERQKTRSLDDSPSDSLEDSPSKIDDSPSKIVRVTP